MQLTDTSWTSHATNGHVQLYNRQQVSVEKIRAQVSVEKIRAHSCIIQMWISQTGDRSARRRSLWCNIYKTCCVSWRFSCRTFQQAAILSSHTAARPGPNFVFPESYLEKAEITSVIRKCNGCWDKLEA